MRHMHPHKYIFGKFLEYSSGLVNVDDILLMTQFAYI